MGRWSRALEAHHLVARRDEPAPAPRRTLRPARLTLVLAGLVALSAWLAHAALETAPGAWPARVLQAVGGWLRAAWSAGG